MLKILDYHLEGILITIGVLVFIVGLGYLIITEMNTSQARYNTCIEAGNQYILGSCVK